MKHRIIFVFIALALGSGCSSVWTQRPLSWNPAMFSGLTLSRGDERWVFSKEGSATFYPNVRVIPGVDSLSWRIKDGWLILTDREGRNRGEFRLESVGPISLTASTRDGKKVKFYHHKA